MSTVPATAIPTALPARLEELADRARERLAHSRAENTITAYRSDMPHFADWCRRHGLPALPTSSDVLVLYLFDHEETLKPATLGRRLSAIRRIHGYPNPINGTVREALSAVKREQGTAQRQARAFSTEDIRAAIDALDLETSRGLRDRAVLLIGYAAALRRSEIVVLNVGDISDQPDGLVIHIRRSKGDQEGLGQVVGVAYGENPKTCPVRALRQWMAAAAITEGPLFRPVSTGGNIGSDRISTQTVNRIAKAAARAAGLDPSGYSAHSLRSGHVTTSLRNGCRDLDVMLTSRHKNLEMVRHYFRESQLFGKHNSSAFLGL